MGRREFTKLKSLLLLMQKASTHPALVNLGQVTAVAQPSRSVLFSVVYNVTVKLSLLHQEKGFGPELPVARPLLPAR